MLLRTLSKVAVGVLSASIIGCCTNGGSKVASLQSTKNIATRGTPRNLEWQLVALPIEVRVSSRNGNGQLLVGESGIVDIDGSGAIKDYRPTKIRGEFLSHDGGVTRRLIVSKKQVAGDGRSFPYVCEPSKIVVVSGNYYVFAECENSSQLWVSKVENGIAMLDITNFASSESTPDSFVQQPIGITALSNRILMSVYTPTGPALLSTNVETNIIQTVWRGDQKDGGIVAFDFVGDNGWMLMGYGKILKSSDGGLNWKESLPLSKIAVSNFVDAWFLSSNEGYIASSNGELLRTIDGWGTWKIDQTFPNANVDHVAANDRTIAISCTDATIVLKKRDVDEKISIDRPSGDLTDLFFMNEKLFIIVDGRLFSAS